MSWGPSSEHELATLMGLAADLNPELQLPLSQEISGAGGAEGSAQGLSGREAPADAQTDGNLTGARSIGVCVRMNVRVHACPGSERHSSCSDGWVSDRCAQ
jgi:hypothetical protein